MVRQWLGGFHHARVALVAVREAFLAVLPVVLAANILMVVLAGVERFGQGVIDPQWLAHWQVLPSVLQLILPVFVAISLSASLAAARHLDKVASVLVSVLCLVLATDFLRLGPQGVMEFGGVSLLTVMPLCYAVTWLLGVVTHSRWFSSARSSTTADDSADHLVNPALRVALGGLLPALVTALVLGMVWTLASQYLPQVLTSVLHGVVRPAPVDERQELLLFQLISQTTWFFGAHGDHVGDAVLQWLNASQPGQTGLRAKYIGDVFLNIGGSGSTLSLILVILLASRRRQERALAWLSLPFAMFNINELLVFGLPIVLNPVLFLPYLLSPMLNAVIAWWAMDAGWFAAVDTQLHWMTPPLLNAYWLSGGQLQGVLVQLLCIFAGALFYLPFWSLSRVRQGSRAQLLQLLGDDSAAYVNEAHRDSLETQHVIHEARQNGFNRDIDQLIEHLQKGRLVMFYQPKVAVASGQVVGVEALLRLQDEQGQIHPPLFLDAVRRAGLSVAMDRKIIDLVMGQLIEWERRAVPVPMVAINVDREYLLDPHLVQELILRAKGLRTLVQIEVTEQTLVHDQQRIRKAVQRLRQEGLSVAIDDFGVGYSSLSSLVCFDVDEVKLDREFLVSNGVDPVKSAMMINMVVALCHQLGMQVLAEGVETDAEWDVLRAAGVDQVQGYLKGRPMPSAALERLLHPAG